MRMTTRIITAVGSILLLALTSCSSVGAHKGANAYFKSWPRGKSPLEIGQHVTQHFIDSPHFNSFKPGPPQFIIYPEVCGMAR